MSCILYINVGGVGEAPVDSADQGAPNVNTKSIINNLTITVIHTTYISCVYDDNSQIINN